MKKTITAEVPLEVYHYLMDFADTNEQSFGESLEWIVENKFIKPMRVIQGDDHQKNMEKAKEMARRRSEDSEGLIVLLLAIRETVAGKSDIVMWPEFKEVDCLTDAKDAVLDYGLLGGGDKHKFVCDEDFVGGQVFEGGAQVARVDYWGEVTDLAGNSLHIEL